VSDSQDPKTQASLPAESEGDEAYCAACNQSFTIDAVFCPNDGAKLVKLKAQVDTLIGRVFDNRYEIRAALGHGGMGTVYRGWQRSVDREVAIKVIHAKLATDRNVTKRFLREARLASRLSQPNIVNVYDFGQSEDDGTLYLVMELLRGKPLSKDLEGGRPLPMKRLKVIAKQICDALDAAHGQGIIHRDLKPGNVVILDEPPGRDLLKILDFGLAKSLVQENTSLVTKTDAILGTPLYMPPEQILGKPSDHTADLYSVGCILYQLAMGRPPFVGATINVVLAAHVQEPVPAFGDHVPDALAAVITGLMAKNPADRIQSARIVHDRIDAIEDDASTIGEIDRAFLTPRPGSQSGPGLGSPVASPTVAGSPPVSHPSLDVPPRRRWMLPLFGLLVLVAAGFVVFRAMQSGVVEPALDAAGLDNPPLQIDAAPAIDPELADAVGNTPPGDARVRDARESRDARIDARPPIPDARVRQVDARVVPDARPPTIDARVRRPPDARVTIDAGVPIVRDAATVVRDARVAKPDAPDIDFLPIKRNKR